MYRIQPTTLTVASHFPRGLTTLGLAWMHGRLDAVALHKGEIAGSWSAPEPVDDDAKLPDLISQAVRQTGYQGNSIHAVLAHPRLAHQLVEIPDAQGAALLPLVRRQVERQKVFDGPAAWAYEKSESAKNSAYALVHLFPQPLLDRIAAAAESAGCRIASIVPPTSILHAQISRLPLGKSDIALLVADLGGTATIVVARRESPLFLARSIDISKARSASGMALELNRTVLYVSQQFGSPVTGVWLFGAEIGPKVEELRTQLQVPVEPSPEEYTDKYWAQEVLRVPAEFATSLISAQQVRAPQRKALVKASAVVVSAFLAVCLAAGTWFTIRARLEGRTVTLLQAQVAQAQARHMELQGRVQQAANRERFVEEVLDRRPDPIPVWFLAYLGDVTPPELVVTNLAVVRATNSWRARIDGRLQSTSSSTAPAETLRRGVETLSDRLRSGPFRALVQTPTADRPKPAAPPNAVSAFADWASQVRARASKASPTPAPAQFTLEARFQ